MKFKLKLPWRKKPKHTAVVETQPIMKSVYPKTIAHKLHDGYAAIEEVDDVIFYAFKEHEPEWLDVLDFDIASDDYDNSLEVYFRNFFPYPYEPCLEIRQAVYDLGFSTVYWNFCDENGKRTEEIRGTEPRRLKEAPERSDAEFCKYNWEKYKINGVDKRFNGDEWIGSKYDCREKIKHNKNPLAQTLHDGYYAKNVIEDTICEAYEKFEPEVYEHLDFDICSDHYDNSLEVSFNNSLPYPYEPSKEVRDAVYKHGFSIIYWNFKEDDEVRGWEPRHTKNSSKWVCCNYGWVDDRFNFEEWDKKYNFGVNNCGI